MSSFTQLPRHGLKALQGPAVTDEGKESRSRQAFTEGKPAPAGMRGWGCSALLWFWNVSGTQVAVLAHPARFKTVA